MKQIFVLAVAAIAFASCQNNTSKKDNAAANATELVAGENKDAAVMSFEKGTYDFGKINQGEKVSYSYKFKNVGKSPLIILNATATCGCTIPEVPKDPIKPGAEGEIKVVFDSHGKSGKQDKEITVTSNAQPHTASLHLTGEINEQSN